MTNSEVALTVIVPTRNRPSLCAALVRMLRASGLKCAIIVADSSDQEHVHLNREFCMAAGAEHRHYGIEVAFYDKLLDALNRVKSPLVVMLPDDDIPLPKALERCLSYLYEHDDFAAAWGYVLDFGIHEGQFDIFRVHWFTPSIDEPSPFERLYHLVRRFQPFFWAVFRTKVLIDAVNQARVREPIVFQELTMTLSAAVSGKIARLPVVYSLRGPEPSAYQREKVEPLFAFIDNADAFFRHYTVYRDSLASFMRGRLGEGADRQLRECTIEQFLDLVHGIGLARELDAGPLNYAVQRALGAPYPPIPRQPDWPGWQEPSGIDMVHTSPVAGRRYIWRDQVLTAEPRSEISVGQDEIASVERQLDHYIIG
jgi:glycosyltransferase domain-containing protein